MTRPITLNLVEEEGNDTPGSNLTSVRTDPSSGRVVVGSTRWDLSLKRGMGSGDEESSFYEMETYLGVTNVRCRVV